MLPDVVGGAVAFQRSELGALCCPCAVAVFLDVVFYEWVFGPAVNGKEDGAGGCSGGSGKSYVSDLRLTNVLS